VPGVAAISLDVNGFFDHLIGARGLSRAEVDREAARVGTIMDGLEARRAGANLPFLDLPYDEGSISQVAELAEQLRSSFDTLLVLGIGGSALGTKTVIDAIGREAGGMRVEVLDNIDPVTIDAVLSSVELSRTAVNVISKSGQTAETMSQFLVVRDRLRWPRMKASVLCLFRRAWVAVFRCFRRSVCFPLPPPVSISTGSAKAHKRWTREPAGAIYGRIPPPCMRRCCTWLPASGAETFTC
jgi:hypothetical protein